jgi:hypothetical protein
MTIVVDDKGARIADEEDFETDDDEIEEGEIVEDTEDEDDEDDDGLAPFEDPMQELGEMLASVLATPDGDTVCSALVNIGNQIESQNRILIKIFTALKNVGAN